MTTHLKPHSLGFTLVELVLVLIITGILAAIAVPRFFNLDTFSNRGFYTEVINAVRYGQQYAVASNCPVRISLTASGYSLNTLAASPDCSGTAFSTPVPNPVTGAPPFTGNNNDVAVSALDGGNNAISAFSFSPLGQVRESIGDITVNVGGIAFQIVNNTGYILEI